MKRAPTVDSLVPDSGSRAFSRAWPEEATILVVSPCAPTQLSSALENDGHRCVTIVRANDLEAAIEEEAADIVLIEVAEVGTYGFELCRALCETAPDRRHRVVLFSRAPAAEAVAVRAFEAGADEFVADIGRTTELRSRVLAQLRLRRERDALRRVRGERSGLRHEASRDPLTGLLNRRAIEAVLRGMAASEDDYALLFLDVDHFKQVNDTLGHDAGDDVLRLVAETLAGSARSGDLIGRLGGEEFVVVLPGAGTNEACAVAERCLASIATASRAPGSQAPVTVSGGVAVACGDEREPWERVLERADRALYDAKAQGRNRVVLAPRPRLAPDTEREARTVSGFSAKVVLTASMVPVTLRSA